MRIPIYVFNLDGTFYKDFPSQKAAAQELCTSDSNIIFAVRHKRPILGKYIASHSNVFPGFEEKIHGLCIPCWAWNTNLELVGNYPSPKIAAKKLGLEAYIVQTSILSGYVADGKYLFTRTPESPKLSSMQLVRLGKKPKVVYQHKDHPDKYQVSKAKWVKAGSFLDMEDAAHLMGIPPYRARIILKGKSIYDKTYRIRKVNRKLLVEKREWEAVGKYKTMEEVCKVVKATLPQVYNSLDSDAVIGGKYKVSRIMQPIETPTV